MHSGAHEGVELPRRVLEALVLGVGRQRAVTGDDLDHVAAHRLAMAQQPLRVGSGLAQQQRHCAEDVLAGQPDQRPQRTGVLGGFVF